MQSPLKLSPFHPKKIPAPYNSLMGPTCCPALPLLLPLCPLLTLLPPYWPLSHTHQGCSRLKVFSLVVLSTWNVLPNDICLANSSPPSRLCSNVIFSTTPTLTTLINTATSLPPPVLLGPLTLLDFCAPQHFLICNMFYYLLLLYIISASTRN